MPSTNWSRIFLNAALIAMAIVDAGCSPRQAPIPVAPPIANRVTDKASLSAQFPTCDSDHDGLLTEEEYLTRGERDVISLRREFLVADANEDGRINPEEFLAVSTLSPEDQAKSITDPIIQLAQRHSAAFSASWTQWDRNADDRLDANEFAAGSVPSKIPGLEPTHFEDWDLNGDGGVSHDESARVLDMAFGVRAPSGELLRTRSGKVSDWRLFRSMKADASGAVSKEDYFDAVGPIEDREKSFQSMDKNVDGRIDFAEFLMGSPRREPASLFARSDRDSNGRLSVAELEHLSDTERQITKLSFRGFDDDYDGELSLREFQMMPHCSPFVPWQFAFDINKDGSLSPAEFHFMQGVPLSALTSEYFRRLDGDQDNMLSLDEWTFQTFSPLNKFQVLDKDLDGQLTESEFTSEGSLPVQRLSRDFKVFDADGNGRISLHEFRSAYYWFPADLRTAPPDPVVVLTESLINEFSRSWGEWDRNRDGVLDASEFKNANIPNRVLGLESTKFNDWDFDRTKTISFDDARRALEIAFGVRTPEGEWMRSKDGRVVDWRLFRVLPKDSNGFVSRDNYFRAQGALDDVEKQRWFNSIDKNHDNRFDYAEFAMGDHRTDPIISFLSLDADLDGRLSKEEIAAMSADQVDVAKYLFPGFDDDKDGALSLSEYRLSPLANLLASWQSANDKDLNQKLSFEEFRTGPGLSLLALTAEYFKRLDTDGDQSLSLDEFPFTTTHPIEIHVQFADGSTTKTSIPDYPIICSPEISPDGKWVAVDGWKHRQNNVAAHILMASLETDEVRDLGTGCIPHWSSDGKQFAYSKYGGGVFVRDFEADGIKEELIDRQGWAIHFSTDGRKVAYVKFSNNLMTHDLKTGEKKLLIPQGKSPYNYIEHNFTWSPDSERICFKGYRPDGTMDVGIVSVTGDDPKLRTRCDAKAIQSDFTWMKEGNRIMFPRLPQAGQRLQIYELDADNEEPMSRYPHQPEDRNNGGLCWSRDGKTLVFMSTR